MLSVNSMDISNEATKDMGTVLKVSGLDALHRSFSLGFLILSDVSSSPRPYVEKHSLFENSRFFFVLLGFFGTETRLSQR